SYRKAPGGFDRTVIRRCTQPAQSAIKATAASAAPRNLRRDGAMIVVNVLAQTLIGQASRAQSKPRVAVRATLVARGNAANKVVHGVRPMRRTAARAEPRKTWGAEYSGPRGAIPGR